MSRDSDVTQVAAGKWACLFCGFIYDEAEGDPVQGIPPGTRWEDLPDDWCCPMCSAEKADFSKV